ncbi:ferrous iron transport protein A, partial [Acinetobacter baumannii]|nr:ferrous iron transport protein A [Acinetobacter baumannii]
MRLSALKVKQAATITKVNRIEVESEQQDLVAIRLESLGFVRGT